MNDSHIKYLRALFDPFHASAIGARIPTSIPTITTTFTLTDDMQLNLNENNLLFCNFNAWRAGPMLALSTTSLLSFDSESVKSDLTQSILSGQAYTQQTPLYYPIISSNGNWTSIGKQATAPGVFAMANQNSSLRLVGAGIRVVKITKA